MTATILIIEDDQAARTFMAPMLRDAGYEVHEAATMLAASQAIDRDEADILILDVQLPDGYGPDLLERLSRDQPSPQVIMVTGFGDIEMAVESMKLGARDFIQKPVNMERLLQAVSKAAEFVAMQRELALYRTRDLFDGYVIGTTSAMRRLEQELGRVAQTNSTVMITGASGTGKEGLAAAVHRASPRRQRAFVPVNCAAFSENLIESILFGYEPGAFTDAKKRKEGLFVTADGGTLFLDEISALKQEVQANLLRVLEEKAVLRVGANQVTPVDVRIVAATNHDLAEMVKRGEFRADLYHRLNVFQLRLPPLSERLDDLPQLVGRFIQHFNAEMGRSVQGCGPLVLDALKASEWPGNIRQLRNAIERAMVSCDGDRLELSHFSPEIANALRLSPARQPALVAN